MAEDGAPQGDTSEDCAAIALAPVDPVACMADVGCDEVLVAAHRGFHEDVPENSLAAMQAAVDVGAHLVEIDVRHTADGVLVVMHDDTVDRTTTGSGDITTLDWADVAKLKLTDQSVGPSQGEPTAHTVPTFDDALDFAKAQGIVLYVDTKTSRVEDVVDAIVAKDARGHALIRTGLGGVLAARERDGDVMVMAPVDDAEALDDVFGQLPTMGFVEIGRPLPDPEATRGARRHGWTVQQDVFVGGDGPFLTTGSTDGWVSYIDAGVRILQSEVADELVALVDARRSPCP